MLFEGSSIDDSMDWSGYWVAGRTRFEEPTRGKLRLQLEWVIVRPGTTKIDKSAK